MNIERILKRFEENYKKDQGIYSNPKETRELLKQYQSIPLTLPITDKSMKRICEVLTRAGYQTSESCEGHNQTNPKIFLECASQYHLGHLTEILNDESNETNFSWDLRTYSEEVFVNSGRSLVYILEPNLAFIDATTINHNDYQKMIDDLDIIGMGILRYFSSVDLDCLENDRKRIDLRVGKFRTPNLPNNFFINSL